MGRVGNSPNLDWPDVLRPQVEQEEGQHAGRKGGGRGADQAPGFVPLFVQPVEDREAGDEEARVGDRTDGQHAVQILVIEDLGQRRVGHREGLHPGPEIGRGEDRNGEDPGRGLTQARGAQAAQHDHGGGVIGHEVGVGQDVHHDRGVLHARAHQRRVEGPVQVGVTVHHAQHVEEILAAVIIANQGENGDVYIRLEPIGLVPGLARPGFLVDQKRDDQERSRHQQGINDRDEIAHRLPVAQHGCQKGLEDPDWRVNQEEFFAPGFIGIF